MEFYSKKHEQGPTPTASDFSIIESNVTEFLSAQHSASEQPRESRYPAHNQRMAGTIKDAGFDSAGIDVATQLHDVVDHGLVFPNHDRNVEIENETNNFIADLYEQVDDKKMFLYGVGCAISASKWEAEVAQVWRQGAVDRVVEYMHDGCEGTEESINEAFIRKSAILNDGKLDVFKEKDILRVLKSPDSLFTDLDVERLRETMTKLDLEGLIIKSAELIDNLTHPPEGNPASTWRDCIEIFNCYCPALDLFGYKDLAAELRGKALEFFYDDPNDNAERQRQLSLENIDSISNFVTQEIDKVEIAPNEYELVGRVKSIGSIRKKLASDDYSRLHIVPDGIAMRVIIDKGNIDEYDDEKIDSFAKQIQEQLVANSYGTVRSEHPKGHGEYEFIIKRGYKGIHMAFMFNDGLEDIPFEIQVVSKRQEELHTYGEASHILYKSGTRPSDEVLKDINHIRLRAEYLRQKASNQSLNPSSIAQIIKYLPNLKTPLHNTFTLLNSGEGTLILGPVELSDIETDLRAKKSERKNDLGAIFLPPIYIEKEQFFELIGMIYPELINDDRIQKAIRLLDNYDLKPRKNGLPTFEAHLLPTALITAISVTNSGEHWDSGEEPVEFLSKKISFKLLHDSIEDTGITEEKIRQKFGNEIALSVGALTSPGEKAIPNKIERRRKYVEKVAQAGEIVSKLFDRMQNHITDLVRLQEGVDNETRKEIFDYFQKSDDTFSDLFDSLPYEYAVVKKLIWEIAKQFGYQNKKI